MIIYLNSISRSRRSLNVVRSRFAEDPYRTTRSYMPIRENKGERRGRGKDDTVLSNDRHDFPHVTSGNIKYSVPGVRGTGERLLREPCESARFTFLHVLVPTRSVTRLNINFRTASAHRLFDCRNNES